MLYERPTVLVPKSSDPDKLRDVEEHRPIYLCNLDYKLFAKILASRLQAAIQILVGDH